MCLSGQGVILFTFVPRGRRLWYDSYLPLTNWPGWHRQRSPRTTSLGTKMQAKMCMHVRGEGEDQVIRDWLYDMGFLGRLPAGSSEYGEETGIGEWLKLEAGQSQISVKITLPLHLLATGARPRGLGPKSATVLTVCREGSPAV